MTTRVVHEHHRRRPSSLAFMARALAPSPRLRADRGVPQVVETWSPVRIDADHLATFRRMTGLTDDGDGIPILYPHVLAFPLLMALLTHRSWPLPIRSALQVRNRLVRHRRIDRGETLDLETRTAAHRWLEKGLEVDVATRLSDARSCCWESVVTFYYRGRFDAPGTAAQQSSAPTPPAPASVERFRTARGGGRAFAQLTGDYNPIHLWPAYARRMRFADASLHPQRVAGMCLARLPRPASDAQTLDLWIKGPVFYGASVTLGVAPEVDGTQFGLFLEGDPRPALVGRWEGRSEAAPSPHAPSVMRQPL
jgi:hypothetical protein